MATTMATTMKQKQTTTTNTTPTLSISESLELIRCLMRVSVFHIAHLRGLFPDKCFKSVEMANLDGIKVSMLTPATDASAALAKWVDYGVADALTKGYLASMQFGIASTPDCSQLIETYTYKFSYAEDATVAAIDLVGGGGAAGRVASAGRLLAPQAAHAPHATLASVKAGVITLIRSLVQLCQTLAPVPAHHHLFIKLTYREAVTPVGYEPPGFGPAPDAVKTAIFPSKPFTFDTGAVQTSMHAVSLALASTLDTMTQGGVGGGGSQPVPGDSAECGASMSILMSGGGGVAGLVPPLPPRQAAGLAAVAEEGEEAECVASQLLEDPTAAVAGVRAYCLARAANAAAAAAAAWGGGGGGGARGAPGGAGRSGSHKKKGAAPRPLHPATPTVDYADLMARFPTFSEPQLDGAIAALEAAGVLVPAVGAVRNVWAVLLPPPPAGCLSVGGSNAAATAAAPPPPPSTVGGIRSDGGGSGRTRSKKRPHHQGPSQASVGGEDRAHAEEGAATAGLPRATAGSADGDEAGVPAAAALSPPLKRAKPVWAKKVSVGLGVVQPAGRGGGGGRSKSRK